MTADHDQIDVRERLAVGWQRFMDIEFQCGPGALVPRPETELLARTAIGKAELASGPLCVVDMCCGVGNLACALALTVPTATLWAADLTSSCVEWTRRNVENLGLRDRVTVVQGDLFAALEGHGLDGRVDLVVCNPPYVSTSRLATGRAVLLQHEPREAFDGGPYGLSIHQRVVAEAPLFLKPGGWLLMEFGLGQERQIELVFGRRNRFSAAQFECNSVGAPRVVAAQFQR